MIRLRRTDCFHAATVLLLVVVTPIAAAQSREAVFHAGISIGQMEAETGVTNLTGGASLDDNDVMFKLFLGSQLDERFAVELSWIDFGKATIKGGAGSSFTLDGTTFVAVGASTFDLEAESFGLSAQMNLPGTASITPYLRFGRHWWDWEHIDTGVKIASFSGDDWFYGLGADLRLSSTARIRVEFEQYEFDGSEFLGTDKEIESYSIGFVYDF